MTPERSALAPVEGTSRPRAVVRPTWTLLSNHGHVLVAVARDPDMRVRDIAASIGITPRATLTILADLESAGYLRRNRIGRRNEYTIDRHQPFRHPTIADHEIGELLRVLARTQGEDA
jgi:hypothetical protein